MYFVVLRAKNKQYYFVLKSKNHKVISTSETYQTRASVIKTIKKINPTWKVKWKISTKSF